MRIKHEKNDPAAPHTVGCSRIVYGSKRDHRVVTFYPSHSPTTWIVDMVDAEHVDQRDRCCTWSHTRCCSHLPAPPPLPPDLPPAPSTPKWSAFRIITLQETAATIESSKVSLLTGGRERMQGRVWKVLWRLFMGLWGKFCMGGMLNGS
jgi:hypothetical protein